MQADDSPDKTRTADRGLQDMAAAATTGLILASVDYLTGLTRLWAVEPSPVREFQSFAVAAAFFAAAALLLQRVVSPVVRSGGPVRTGEIRMFCAGAALIAGYAAGPLMPDGFSPIESARRGLVYLLVAPIPVALLLGVTLARFLPQRNIGQLLGRVWTSAVFGLGAFLATAAWMRASAPETGPLGSRLAPALTAGAAWLGCLAWLHRRPAARLRGFAVILFLGVLARAALLGATPRLMPDLGPAEPPAGISRIVLITIDTLRADALSCYGPEGTSTPNIDALARRGLRYTHAIAPAPWTLPSLASLMTGVDVPVHQATSHKAPIPSSLPTLAERLAGAGWMTGALGRNAFLVGVRGLNRGFHSYRMFPRPPRLAWPTFGGRLLELLRPRQLELDVSSRRIADLAIEWLEKERNEVSFLWCHFFDPHIPYEPPAEFMPSGVPPERFGRAVTEVRPLREGAIVPTRRERAWIRELYLGEVRYVDAQVGRILRTLEQLPRADETLVILTSDHGEEFWEHDGFEHGHALYQEVIQVPLIVVYPGRIEPGVVDRTVNIRAIFPTIMDLLDLSSGSKDFYAAPLYMPGINEPRRSPVFSSSILYGPNQETVIDKDWKFIRGREAPWQELYDLANDPGEQSNRAREESLRVETAGEELDRWRNRAEARRSTLTMEDDTALDLSEETLRELERLGYIN